MPDPCAGRPVIRTDEKETDMNLNERAEMAVQRKNSGKYNCAQAVTTALADQTGLQEEQMKQISAGFCAGIGNMQATCGALIGAGMIAGLKTEGKGDPEGHPPDPGSFQREPAGPLHAEI